MTAEPFDYSPPLCGACDDRGWLPDERPCDCTTGELFVAQSEFELHLVALDDGLVL